MRRLLSALSILAAACAGSLQPLAAQSLPSLPRGTVTTGVNDSALFLVSDSARRTRAVTFGNLKTALSGGSADSIMLKNGTAAAPSLKFTNSTSLGLYRFGADSLGFAASGRLAMFVRDSQVLAQKGRQDKPSYSFTADFSTGMSYAATDTLVFSAGGTQVLRMTSAPKLMGGAASMTLLAGTGNSRTMTLQTTTSAGTAKNTLVLGADTSATFLGDVILTNNNAKLRGSNATAALSFNGGVINLVNFSGTTALQLDGSTATFAVPARLSGSSAQFRGSGNHSASVPAFTDGNAIGAGMWVTGNSTADTVRFATDSAQTIRMAANGHLLGPASNGGSLNLSSNTGTNGTITLRATSSGGASGTSMTVYYDSVSYAAAGAQSLVVKGGAATVLQGGAGNMQLIGGTGASRKLILRGTDAASAPQTVAIIDTNMTLQTNGGGQGRVFFTQGTAALPSLAFTSNTTTGFYRVAGDTIGITTAGTKRLLIADQSATAAGDVALCVTTTGVTGVIRQGATCGTSSAKVKTDIGSIFNPIAKTMALQPRSYSYIPGVYGGRHEYGLVADSTMAVDSTLVFRAESDEVLPNGQTIRKGDALNVNDRAVLSLLIATVQQQQRQIDSLKAAIARKP